MIQRSSRAQSNLLAWSLAAVLGSAQVAAADFSLFGDVTLVDSDAPDSPSSFALGSLDFYVNQKINDRMTAAVELDFEADDGGGFEADLERLWIRYEVSEAFQIAAGRFHQDPKVETVAVFGYSGKVQLLSRIEGKWKVETLFQDTDKGHGLAVAELDGRNNTRELLSSGYSGRIVMLARPAGYGRRELCDDRSPRPCCCTQACSCSR